jgi:peptidoglycan/LPS O-acetylase OafA/YrhL
VTAEDQSDHHLHYIDLVRVLTVGLVIGVHVLLSPLVVPTVQLGAVVIVFHASRNVFLLLMAFVLIYSTGRRKVHWPRFWRRRYLFIVVPYVVWTVVYFYADPGTFVTLAATAREFGYALLTGTARYQLYFLLVSMQIYLVVPLIRGLLRVTQGRHGLLLAGCAAFQLLFSLAVQQQWSAGPLTGWLRTPDALLPSYLGYILAGAVAAWHREELVDRTRRHIRLVFGGCAAAVALTVGVYLAQVFLAGQSPLVAGVEFQPVVAVESVAIAWAFLAAGLLWQERGLPARRLVGAGSDASFGIYLVHPLIIQAVEIAAATTGVAGLAQTAPAVLVLIVLVVIIMPAIYFTCGLFTAGARRTPASLALTGRLRLRPSQPPPDSAQSSDELALVNTGGTR